MSVVDLLAFCQSLGGELGDGVVIGGSLRGLVSSRRLEAGSLVARVPLTGGLPMHVSDWGRTRLSGALPDDVSDEHALAAMVACGGSWVPYVRSLPRVDVPRAWPKRDLAMLPDALASRAAAMRARDDAAYHRLEACCCRALSRSRFDEALATVSSRAHAVRVFVDGEWTSLRMLIPLVDMMNWSKDPNVICETRRDNVFECSTTRNVSADAALTAAYSASTPADFLFDYGFVPSSDDDLESCLSAPPWHRSIQRALLSGDALRAHRAALVLDFVRAEYRCIVDTSLSMSEDFRR